MTQSVKSRPPGLSWVGYNLFRLTGGVFLIWMLVIQFVALSSDLKEYSRSKDGSSTPTSTSTRSWGQATASVATATISSASASSPAKTSLVVNTTPTNVETSTFEPSSPTEAMTIQRTSDTPAVTVISRPTTEAVPGLGNAGNMARIRRRAEKNETESSSVATGEEKYFGSSAIPDQPGGVFFVVVSRLVIAIACFGLISAQIGLPETFLYEYVSWLGPQSTPSCLGILQLIVCIEHLRVHASTRALLPAWALLAVGSINVILGIILICLGRRLPKKPPPPLYFSLSQRPLYWTPPPSFYRQLFHDDLKPNEVVDKDSPADPEKALPPSNAHEIGLTDFGTEDEAVETLDERKTLTTYDPITRGHRSKKSGFKSTVAGPAVVGSQGPESDVRNGGYPTFSGMGITTPGRQVPAGVIEGVNGNLRYTTEEDQQAKSARETSRTTRFGQRSRTGDSSKVRSSNAISERSDVRSGVAETTMAMLAPLNIQKKVKKNDAVNLTRHPEKASTMDGRLSASRHSSRSKEVLHEQRGSSFDSAPGRQSIPPSSTPQDPTSNHGQSSAASLLQVRLPLPKARARAPTVFLDTIGEEPNTATTFRGEHRGSAQAASSALTPQFPFPPVRQSSGRRVGPSSGDIETKRANRESTVAELGHSAPSLIAGIESPIGEESLVSSSTTPRSAHTWMGAPPTFHAPSPPSTEPSPRSKRPISEAPSRSRSHDEAGDRSTAKLRPTTSLRSSLAHTVRSPRTSVARTQRVARGVRFDVGSPGARPKSAVGSPPSSGKTNNGGGGGWDPVRFTFVSRTPKPRSQSQSRRHSIASISSEGSYESDARIETVQETPARPESFASESSEDTMNLIGRPESADMEASSLGYANESRGGTEERAGLPRRNSSITTESAWIAVRPKSFAVLGGGYLSGGNEARAEKRRPSSVSADSL